MQNKPSTQTVSLHQHQDIVYLECQWCGTALTAHRDDGPAEESKEYFRQRNFVVHFSFVIQQADINAQVKGEEPKTTELSLRSLPTQLGNGSSKHANIPDKKNKVRWIIKINVSCRSKNKNIS